MSKVYPSWRYHKTEDPKLVQNEEQDNELGPDWADTPAAFASEPEAQGEASAASSDGLIDSFEVEAILDEAQSDEAPKSKKSRRG